jgi:RNA polymerase sigma factor (sigma-70 family)
MRWERSAAPASFLDAPHLILMSETTLQTLLDRRAGFLAFVQRRVADPALAEDILQAAYMRALERSGGLREDDSAVAWFYSVLRNAVIDFYRRRATENKAMDGWAAELGFADGDLAAPDASARKFICGCIAHVLPTLKPAYAEILREVDLDEESLVAFAKKHELTAGNAAVRAHRARAALRKELARVCGACSLHACLDCCCKAPAA